MSKNVTLWGSSYSNVPALTVPQTGGGTALFTDTSPTTAVASDVRQGEIFFLSDGTQETGTMVNGNNLEYGITDGTVPRAGIAKAGYAEIGE